MINNETMRHLRETALFSCQTIRRKQPLQALTFGPMICFITTIIFVTIHTVRGPCSESDEIRDEYYEVDDLISFHLCCVPEWPIGATGYCISGILGLYSVPYIHRSRNTAFGRCCCCARKCSSCCGRTRNVNSSTMGDDTGNGDDDDSSHYRRSFVSSAVAMCTATMSIGIAGVGIFSMCWLAVPHGVCATLFFLGAIVLMFILICSGVDARREEVVSRSAVDLVNLREEEEDVKYIRTLRHVSRFFRGISFLCLILSFAFGAAWGSFVAESFVGCVGLFALYAVLCEMVLDEIISHGTSSAAAVGGGEGGGESDYILSVHDER